MYFVIIIIDIMYAVFSKTLVVLIIYTNQAVQQNTVSRSCTATLIVKVLDINDNIPIFNPTEYRTNITEHSSVGTTVVHLRATDLDVCNHLRVCYTIIIKTLYMWVPVLFEHSLRSLTIPWNLPLISRKLLHFDRYHNG